MCQHGENILINVAKNMWPHMNFYSEKGGAGIRVECSCSFSQQKIVFTLACCSSHLVLLCMILKNFGGSVCSGGCDK